MAKKEEPEPKKETMGLPGEWADVEVGYDFSNPPSLFEVEGMKTERDEGGGLKSGYQGRWVRIDDIINTEDKFRRLKYRPCLDPEVKAPMGNRKDGEGTPWQIKANGETYELWHRPVELAHKEKEEYLKRSSDKIEEVSRYNGPAGDSSVNYQQTGQMGRRSLQTGLYAKRGR